MKHTELREQFRAAVKLDPWMHALTHHTANAWAMGYEQALVDNGLDEERLTKRHSDRVEMALEWMTDDRRKAQAQALIALAALAKGAATHPPSALMFRHLDAEDEAEFRKSARKLTCPECGERVWDGPSGHKLAKCWNTEGHADGGTLAFDTMGDDE